jgi:four helix bundle protein
MGPDTVRTLRVWQEGMALVKESYALTSAWPKSELFGLTGQIRRAAVSIPTNLAEGKGRGTSGELVRFARIAQGSAYELDTLLEIAQELEFADAERVASMRKQLVSNAQAACILGSATVKLHPIPTGLSPSHNPHPTTHDPPTTCYAVA